MNFVNEFSYSKTGGETVIEFDYPFKADQGSDFMPSLREVFSHGMRASKNGLLITEARLFEEAIEWLKKNVREGFYRIEGRYQKIVCQTRGGVEVMVDGDAVRWGVVFKFLRDADAVLFYMRFA